VADIYHDFTIKSPPSRVFETMATPEGLDRWWTRTAAGVAKEGAEYELYFGDGFDWRARVTRYVPWSAFELLITDAYPDWIGTHVGCRLDPQADAATRVSFYHTGWPTPNDHWRLSSFRWAMYLRLARRYLEHGEVVAFAGRLDA
jgi:uncharacterized protein YndB with AHSA1/START domain